MCGDRRLHAPDLIERYPVLFVLLFRFAYGLRVVAPLAIGASRLPARLFIPLSMVAAIMWAASSPSQAIS
jgi:membrane protein DedA with SNARE-associated domain